LSLNKRPPRARRVGRVQRPPSARSMARAQRAELVNTCARHRACALARNPAPAGREASRPMPTRRKPLLARLIALVSVLLALTALLTPSLAYAGLLTATAATGTSNPERLSSHEKLKPQAFSHPLRNPHVQAKAWHERAPARAQAKPSTHGPCSAEPSRGPPTGGQDQPPHHPITAILSSALHHKIAADTSSVHLRKFRRGRAYRAPETKAMNLGAPPRLAPIRRDAGA